MTKLVGTTTMEGYGRNNSGFKSKYSSWKRLNNGKNLTGTQMKMLKIRPVKTKPKK